MPAKNSVKKFVSDAYYHVYNRGNNKESIYWKESDYKIFRNIFRSLLNELHNDLLLDCFCLLPNHFHFLIHQKSITSIEKFMRRGSIRYVMFVNKRYNRVGRLFQSSYKAIIVPPQQIQGVRTYILSNPINAGYKKWKHVGMGSEI